MSDDRRVDALFVNNVTQLEEYAGIFPYDKPQHRPSTSGLRCQSTRADLPKRCIVVWLGWVIRLPLTSVPRQLRFLFVRDLIVEIRIFTQKINKADPTLVSYVGNL